MAESLSQRIESIKTFDVSLTPSFPTKGMLVEVVNLCNHKCIFCGHQKTKHDRKVIDGQFLRKVLDDAYELGMREVGLYSTGEPFLCAEIDDHIAYAKTVGYDYVYVTTNGSLASPEKLRAAIDSGLDSIKFSINAGSRETYRLIHGVDHFDRVIENLQYCCEYRKQSKKDFKIYVSFVVTRFTENEVCAFRDEYSKYCDEIVFATIWDHGGLVPEIYEYIVPTDYVKDSKRECWYPFTSIGITADGYLTACACADFFNQLIIADLNNTSLAEAWNCEKYVALRKRFIEDDLHGIQCYDCVYGKSEKFKPLQEKYARRIELTDVYSEKYVFERLKKLNG